MYDILIKNGTVIDGSGTKERFKADVAISGGVIARIGELGAARAKVVIDATGRFVTPGFIDALNHSDMYATLFTMPDQDSLVSQGITTIMGGQCGYSLAPHVEGNSIASEARWTEPSPINVDWSSTAEFLERLQEKKLKVNFGTLTGYDTLAEGVLRGEHRRMGGQEHEMTRFLLERALEEGSYGLSLRFPRVSENAQDGEFLRDLFSVIKREDVFVAVHCSDDREHFLDSLRNIIHYAETERVAVHFSHMKVWGEKFWHNFQKGIEEIERAAARGLPVTFDLFPYASSSLELALLLPAWAMAGGPRLTLERLKSSFERKNIIKDLNEQHLDFSKITVASRAPDAVCVGKTIKEIADAMETSEAEALLDMVAASRLRVIGFAHVLDEANVAMGVAHPLSIVASAGVGFSAGARNRSHDLPHPRSFGAFPRFLKKYIREKPLLSFEQAIEKITSAPARLLSLSKRGILQEGYAADIVVLDPDAVADAATFKNPYQISRGIESVIVNGVLVRFDGSFVDHFPGMALRRR